ncbi:hypothetical protein O181_133530 [Austropuccinia psidii MF-1]|uniref:Uncharacterized protein n=1 Tax=Austropuccinia psidii MF-1 TaxID=1389203 RepID=A0A9Q3L893_9BASI|nr:hypothetical protein [Austropuccinia psidii MF-1]
MEDPFAYAKDNQGKSNATPDFKLGDLVLVSTTDFNNIKGCIKLKGSFSEVFVIKALHGENAIVVELSQELSNKCLTFPVILIKPYRYSYSKIFPSIYLLLNHLVLTRLPSLSKKGNSEPRK